MQNVEIPWIGETEEPQSGPWWTNENVFALPGLRFALVGCGRIAQSHIEAIAGSTGAVLTAIVEPREEAGRAASEQTRSPLFRDFTDEAILAETDAVIVCTPPALHYQITKHFLERGKHVLCEKPFTLQTEEAAELVALAEGRDAVLMMASKFRYVDDVIKSKAIIEAGILGDIVLYDNAFCSRVDMRGRWNADPRIGGGGVLIDNGTHSVDIARFLLGPVTGIQAQSGPLAQALDVEDTIHVRFRTDRGVIGNIDLSWTINKESPYYIGVYGERGTLLVGWKGSLYRQEGNPDWVPFGSGYSKRAAFERQLGNFVASIHKREMPLITPADALASVRVIEAAYASASRDHWVQIGEEPTP
jgi:predicted dehydrogenase